MGTISIDTTTTPSQKNSIASLMNALNILPSQKARSSRKVSFSTIMNEKTNHVSVASGKSKKASSVIKAESATDPKSEPETTDATAGEKVAGTAQRMKRPDSVPLLTLPEKKETVKAGLGKSAVPEKDEDVPSFKTPVVNALSAEGPALTTPISAGEKLPLITAALETAGEKSPLVTAALEISQDKNAATAAGKTLSTRDFTSSPDKKNIKPTVDTANSVNPQSEESLFTTDHSPKAESIQKKETAFMKHVAAEMRQKDNGPSPETILSQVRQTVITSQDDSQPVASSEGLATSDETQKHVFTAGGVNDAKGEAILLRADTSHIQAVSETKVPSSEKAAGIRTQAVIDQIIEAKQSMGNDFGRARIVLDPPNLGTVDLDIIVRREHVNVVMTADNASVQQILQSHADDIRAALQQQNLKIETFQVLLQDNTSGQQYGNSGAAFEQQREHSSRQAVPDSVPTVADSSSNEGPAPVRGLISVFA